jgi:hypothetical protein
LTKLSGTTTARADHGLSTAHERLCIYRWLGAWAKEYGATTALEGPLDGFAGIRGVHCAGLASTDIKVVSAVTNDDAAQVAKNVYARAAPSGSVDIRVVPETTDLSHFLPPSDLVVTCDALALVHDWKTYLQSLRQLTNKVLVVVVRNPQFLGVMSGGTSSYSTDRATGGIETLAPVLWELGRVREHQYVAASPLSELVSAPIRTLVARGRSVLASNWNAHAATKTENVQLGTYSYGPERWPYFGSETWTEELRPVLLQRARAERGNPRYRRWLARMHAFVVDVRPRTPQAKRKLLRMSPDSGPEGARSTATRT